MKNNNSGRLWCLNDAQLIRAQSVPRKYPPHHYTTTSSLNRWDKAFMFFMPNSDPTSECRSRNRDSSDQATVYDLLLSNFVESVWIVSSVCCSYLTGAAPGVVFCCWSPSASGFDVLCVQRCILQTLVVTSGYLSYCCLSIISNQSAHSPLTSDINKAFSSTQLPSLDIFSFSDHSL